MKALVTGAAGFVGANLVRHLSAAGHEPVAAVRPGGDPWRLTGIGPDAEIVELDLADCDAITATVARLRPDVIFHLAANGAYSWQQDLSRMLAINVRSLQALLDAAGRIEAAVINAGSSSEYGYQDHPPDERELVRPNSHYAVTKVAATHLCQLASDKSNVRTATLRLYSVYGPWEEPGRLMPTLVRHCRAGTWPSLVDPSTARDFVWIEDVCRAFVRAAEVVELEPGAVFNIASGEQTTLGQLVETAARTFSVDEAPRWGTMAARHWDTSTWVGNPERARLELGWEAETSIETGLQTIADWFDANPALLARYE